MDHQTEGVREIVERFQDEAGRLEIYLKCFAFGYTVVPEEADIVVNSFALLQETFHLQQSQLVRTLDAVYQDGYYRGSTYAYNMGRRDAAFAIEQG